ncbi:MAG: hypothetical protein EAY75_04685, partial [Bacteroidetes bacterium]
PPRKTPATVLCAAAPWRAEKINLTLRRKAAKKNTRDSPLRRCALACRKNQSHATPQSRHEKHSRRSFALPRLSVPKKFNFTLRRKDAKKKHPTPSFAPLRLCVQKKFNFTLRRKAATKNTRDGPLRRCALACRKNQSHATPQSRKEKTPAAVLCAAAP